MPPAKNENVASSNNNFCSSQQADGDDDDNHDYCIIFLDIDGVLLPFPADGHTQTQIRHDNGLLFPDACLRALNRLLAGIPNHPRIVLSSTWRVRADYRQDILQCFQAYGHAPLKNVATANVAMEFYDMTDPSQHSERQWEIHSWLEMHQEKKRQRRRDNNITTTISKQSQPMPMPWTFTWIALDDEDLMRGSKNERLRPVFEGHVIQTASHVGLTNDDAEEAIRLWKKQKQSLLNIRGV
jgi:hypothetical protein